VSDGSSDSPSEPNEALLRYLAGVLADTNGIARVSSFPSNKRESLVAALETSYYPENVEEVRLEIRADRSGDFHVSYFESYLGEQRRCRWDRHEQPHSTRDHFHPLPNASTAETEDCEYPTDLDRTLSEVVLPWVERRLGDLWSEV
jgi:hypothetical protein